MVECQLRPNGVVDTHIVEAFRKVPREAFLPASLHPMAYLDEDVAIGQGRFLIEPVAHAKLIQAMALQPNFRVLDIGCLYGYSSAILAHLVKQVIAVDTVDFIQMAKKNIEKQEIQAVSLYEADLFNGLSHHAPFDAIVINGAIQITPDHLIEQLKPEGVLACFTHDPHKRICVGACYKRHGNHLVLDTKFDAFVPVLAGFEQNNHFVF